MFFAAPAAARAAETTTTSSLSWVRLPGAEPCITTPELSARVEKHLGRSVFVSPSVAEISIEARIEKAGTKYRAVVGGTRADRTAIGSRDLESSTSDCRSIDDALVLVIALMIDPNAMSPAVPPPAPPAVAQPEIIHERIIVRDIEHLPAPAPPTATPWLIEATLGGGASIERAPGVAPAANVAARFGPSRKIAFEVLFGVMPHAELAVLGGQSIEYSIFEGGLAYCPTLGFLSDRLDLGACAGLRAGAMRSRGKAFTKNAEVDRGLVDVAVGPRFEARIVGPLLLLANINIFVPLIRQETTITNSLGNSVVLDRRRPLGAEAGLALGLRFSP